MPIPGRTRAVAGCLIALLGWGCAQGTQADPLDLVGSGGKGGSAGHVDASADSTPDSPATDAPADATPPDVGPDVGPDAGPDDATAGDAPGDGANLCAGVTCATPPANVCADASNLRVYSPTGTCAQGQCQYASSLTACAAGCANDACNGDPCIGVTCATPPQNVCADATHLGVYDLPGTCSGGTCSYTTHQQYCGFGCANGVCNGDPCSGQTCATPPAAYCADASNLAVYDVPGTCTSGACKFTSHTQYCAFGCAGAACAGDPCAGVSCNTPTASYCTGASTLRTFASSGTCANGTCTYASTDKACPGGCTNGVCKDCATSTDCGAGKWCNGGTCATCGTDQHCGASCADCTTTGDVCGGGTSCVGCTTDSQCGAGKWCSSSTCATCNTAQKCGASCATCAGGTPDCNGTACVCNATSCGANQRCAAGACAVCKTDAACGGSCTACSGGTPKCLDQGTTSACVECLVDGDCTGGLSCKGNACVDLCAMATATFGFESTAQGFTHSPTDGISGDDPWALGTPTGVTCHGGSKCWATNLATAGYSDCQTAQLVSPAIDLSACATSTKTVTISFWQYYAFEPKSSGTWWDGGVLQISKDGGSTWADVTTTFAYQGALTGSFSSCTPTPDVAGHTAWSGTIPGGAWAVASFDVAAAYKVATFKLRWLFGSDGATTNRGWFIDDVAVVPH